MPSGSKKRKAAKKKKELEEANNNNNTHDHDDAKSQDDKGSDGGELSSPASQDHHMPHNPFNEGDPSVVRSIGSEDSKSMDESEQKSGSTDQGVIEIQWSLKPDDAGSSTSRSSSSSSSSSDDESREKERDKEASSVTEIESSGDGDVVAELSPIIESIKPVVPVSEETISILESAPVDNLLVSEAIKSQTSAAETVTKYVAPSVEEDSKVSPSEVKTNSKGNEGKDSAPSDKDSMPPVAVVQRTSVLSCCGLCDLFSR